MFNVAMSNKKPINFTKVKLIFKNIITLNFYFISQVPGYFQLWESSNKCQCAY